MPTSRKPSIGLGVYVFNISNKLMKVLMLTMTLVVAVVSRHVQTHNSLNSVLSEYVGSALLNQATGGLLGTNKTLLGMIGTRIIGKKEEEPKGLAGLARRLFGKKP